MTVSCFSVKIYFCVLLFFFSDKSILFYETSVLIEFFWAAMFLRFLSNCFLRFIELEPDAKEGKCRGSKTQTNGDGAETEGGPMPACRFPPRFREPARRTTALASTSCRCRGTTTLAVMAAASGKGCV
jgi:hypothetical protein